MSDIQDDYVIKIDLASGLDSTSLREYLMDTKRIVCVAFGVPESVLNNESYKEQLKVFEETNIAKGGITTVKTSDEASYK